MNTKEKLEISRKKAINVIPELNNKTGFTHSGIFHADDVFSAALLRIFVPDIKIERGSAIPPNFKGIVFDIGLGEYDHHQKNNEIRLNGIPYASFGKLWRKLGLCILDKASSNQFEQTFVYAIDYADNTGTFDSLSYAVNALLPAYSASSKEFDEAFNKAVDFAYSIIYSWIIKKVEMSDYEERIIDIYNNTKDKKILEFDYYMPVSTLSDKKTFFVIYKTERGFCCIPIKNKKGLYKVRFPYEWTSNIKNAQELFSTINYCQKGGGLLCATDKKDLYNACYYILNKNTK